MHIFQSILRQFSPGVSDHLIRYRLADQDYFHLLFLARIRNDLIQDLRIRESQLLRYEVTYPIIEITTPDQVITQEKARSEERAQENLDRIQIETKKIGGIVSAVTTIKKEMNSNSNNESNFTANAMIEAKYGNIEVGNLQDAQLDLGYVGTAKIRNAKDLTIDSKYSNLDIQDIQSLRMEIKYGNLTIESVSRLDMEIKYSDAKIGTLKDALNVSSLSYSNLKIRNLSPSFSKVNVESHYGNLEVALPAKTSFRIVAENMKYSSCDVNGFNITRKHFDDEDRDKNYTYEINGGKQPTIHFEGNRYGNLKVKAN